MLNRVKGHSQRRSKTEVIKDEVHPSNVDIEKSTRTKRPNFLPSNGTLEVKIIPRLFQGLKVKKIEKDQNLYPHRETYSFDFGLQTS